MVSCDMGCRVLWCHLIQLLAVSFDDHAACRIQKKNQSGVGHRKCLDSQRQSPHVAVVGGGCPAMKTPEADKFLQQLKGNLNISKQQLPNYQRLETLWQGFSESLLSVGHANAQ